MTTKAEALDLARRPRTRVRRRWRLALRRLRELLRHPDRTGLALEVQRALDPDMHERALRRMLAHPEGRRVFRERPSLRDALARREALERLPEGSLGRAYLDHLDRYGLEPTKLVALAADDEGKIESADPDVCWMAERSRLTHDLWHVLSGYGADEVGEATLLLFSLGQVGGLSNALLAGGANFEMVRMRGPGWLPYAWRAWRRGRRAHCLAALPYERLLPVPLVEVRAAAGIEPPERAHPGGVRYGNPVRARSEGGDSSSA